MNDPDVALQAALDRTAVAELVRRYKRAEHERYARLLEAARTVVAVGKYPCSCAGDPEYACSDEAHLLYCPMGLALRNLAEVVGE